MSDILETYKVERDGEILEVIKEYDSYPEDPRDFSEHFTTFFTFERRHRSPDSHSFTCAQEWADKNKFDLGNNINDLIESMSKKGFVALPVWRYEHSGVCYKAASANPFYDDWDSGIAGVIYASKKDACEAFGVKRLSASTKEKVLTCMKSEVDEWSDYANGDVFQYTLRNLDGSEEDFISNIYGNIDINHIFNDFGVKELKPEMA